MSAALETLGPLRIVRQSPAPEASPMASTGPAPRALFIPAGVLALDSQTLTARLILADVLNLFKVSGRVFARDSYFAERLCVGKRTAGTALAELEAAGYLLRPKDYRATATKRQLIPTPLAMALLVAESATTPPGLVVADSATTPLHLAESATSPCRFGNKSLPIRQQVLAESADISKNFKKELKKEFKESSNSDLGQARAAAPSVEKKVIQAAPQKKEAAPTAVFRRPTTAQVAEAMVAGGLLGPAAQAEAAAFCDYYISNGYRVGKTAMKDWPAAVRNWLRRNNTPTPTSKNQAHGSFKQSYANPATSAAGTLHPEQPTPGQGWGY